jgi:ABC-2 type transport system permease protein
MTTMLRLVRGEIHKLTTTKLPWGFLAVLVVIAGLDAAVVAFGSDMDGSKAFVATAADQQSLMAFAFNALIGTSLFGAIAVAREYGHHTVVPMYLTSPNRTRAVIAQLIAVLAGGAVLAFLGQALVVLGVALAQLFAATTLAGAIGATLGAGLGALIRNIGGAVTTAVLVLFVIPPLAAQLFSEAASWIPTSLFAVISGVSPDVSVWAALLAVGAWALVPAAAGLVAVQRRDVV